MANPAVGHDRLSFPTSRASKLALARLGAPLNRAGRALRCAGGSVPARRPIPTAVRVTFINGKDGDIVTSVFGGHRFFHVATSNPANRGISLLLYIVASRCGARNDVTCPFWWVTTTRVGSGVTCLAPLLSQGLISLPARSLVTATAFIER